jgi:hypothetical protein
MDQKAGIADVKANFKELGDLLHAKFSLLEDCSEGLRDVLVYQKYFYPLHLQTAISENMQNFKAAMTDDTFVSF